MKRLAGLVCCAALGMAFAPGCGGGGAADAGGFPLPTDIAGQDKGGGADTADAGGSDAADGDVAGQGDGVGDAEPVEPGVSILGIAELEGTPGYLCGKTQTVIVGATGIGGRTLALFVRYGGQTYRLDTTAAPGTAPGLYELAFDFSVLALPADENPVDGSPNIPSGKPVELTAAALAEGETDIPADANLKSSMKLTFDAAPPTVELLEPDPSFPPMTLSGLATVRATVKDDQLAREVEVTFGGESLGVFEAPDGTTANWSFDDSVDLRDVQTQFGQLVVTARDACGLEGQAEYSVKVIKAPRFRLHEHYTVPGKQLLIYDSEVTDWNDDGYDDVLFATNQGVALALNDGEVAKDNADGRGRFSTMKFLTDVQTFGVGAVDFDGDGRRDMAVVERRGQPYYLVIYRSLGDSLPSDTEEHLLDIAATAKVVDVVAADFSGNGLQAPDGTPRDDIVVATNESQDAIVVFKRQHADEPQAFDMCTTETVVVEEGDGGASEVTQTVCPTLFSDGVKAGAVDQIAHVVPYDVTGVTADAAGPDGYIDLLVGAKNVNALNVYANRFPLLNDVDTMFSNPVSSFIWPQPEKNSASTQFFCLGNFIETGEADDPIDAVVGTEMFATWRVARGVQDGGQGKFTATKVTVDDPYEMTTMSGTAGGDVRGVVCADFDGDGHSDFALVSDNARILQVHLGDGTGHFNQTPSLGPLSNPANEGIGFAVDRDPKQVILGDFNGDGRPDIFLVNALSEFSIYINDTTAEHGFDFVAARAVLAPLGRDTLKGGGVLSAMAIGDVTGDGVDDLVALRPTQTQPLRDWIQLYQPWVAQYRDWLSGLDEFGKTTPGRDSRGPLVYVWTKGQYGPNIPSYPAAYDHIGVGAYPVNSAAGPQASQIELLDVVSPGGAPGPDGALDILYVGKPGIAGAGSVGVLANQGHDFWDPGFAQVAISSMFAPVEGFLSQSQSLDSVAFVNPGGMLSMPLVVAGMGRFTTEPASITQAVRACPWTQEIPFGLATFDYWACPQYGSADDILGKQIGGGVTDMKRLAVEGEGAGAVTHDPAVPADLLMLNSITKSMSYFRWNDQAPDPSFPWDPPIELSVGEPPRQLALRDADNDGSPDIAVAVTGNIFVAFGQQGLNPFQSLLPVDKNPGVKQNDPWDVVFSDVNNDGFSDVVFTNKTPGTVTVYLNIGTNEDTTTQSRKFHGPVTIPTCARPIQILSKNLEPDKSDCEDLVVLCGEAGAILTLRTESAGCAK